MEHHAGSLSGGSLFSSAIEVGLYVENAAIDERACLVRVICYTAGSERTGSSRLEVICEDICS